PTAPTILTTAVSATQVALTWTGSSGTVSAYAIWRQAATGTWSRVGAVGSTITTYTDTTVSANATYAYHVRAINNIGASDWSNLVTVTMARPAAPSKLAATVVSGTQLTLTWTASSGTVAAYAIWRQAATGTWSRVGVVGPTITTYTDTTVSANVTYAYLVRATNGIGAS